MTMPETVKHTHPIRGVLWGLMFGIGLTFVLVVTTVISLDLVALIVVTLLATIAGVVWSLYGPAKAAKGPPPAPPPETSRFDDTDHATVPSGSAGSGGPDGDTEADSTEGSDDD